MPTRTDARHFLIPFRNIRFQEGKQSRPCWRGGFLGGAVRVLSVCGFRSQTGFRVRPQPPERGQCRGVGHVV